MREAVKLASGKMFHLILNKILDIWKIVQAALSLRIKHLENEQVFEFDAPIHIRARPLTPGSPYIVTYQQYLVVRRVCRRALELRAALLSRRKAKVLADSLTVRKPKKTRRKKDEMAVKSAIVVVPSSSQTSMSYSVAVRQPTSAMSFYDRRRLRKAEGDLGKIKQDHKALTSELQDSLSSLKIIASAFKQDPVYKYISGGIRPSDDFIDRSVFQNEHFHWTLALTGSWYYLPDRDATTIGVLIALIDSKLFASSRSSTSKLIYLRSLGGDQEYVDNSLQLKSYTSTLIGRYRSLYLATHLDFSESAKQMADASYPALKAFLCNGDVTLQNSFSLREHMVVVNKYIEFRGKHSAEQKALGPSALKAIKF